MQVTTTTKTTTPRPCSILTDGHRAQATHTVASLAYGHIVGRPAKRLFCGHCAAEEAAFLQEMGHESIAAPR